MASWADHLKAKYDESRLLETFNDRPKCVISLPSFKPFHGYHDPRAFVRGECVVEKVWINIPVDLSIPDYAKIDRLFTLCCSCNERQSEYYPYAFLFEQVLKVGMCKPCCNYYLGGPIEYIPGYFCAKLIFNKCDLCDKEVRVNFKDGVCIIPSRFFRPATICMECYTAKKYQIIERN